MLKIDAEGYKYYDFKFSLKENEILKLFIGEGLYKRKEEAIRELLKNCVDTCRHNSEVLKAELGSDNTYEPKITFKITPEKDRLIISDNGFGMDEYIIDNHFTKIGRSYYISSEFLEKEYNFSPVGELGIGFLSCFMIADKIEIETKTDHSKSLLIEIDNISSYFFVKDGNRRDSGTKITLYLKENTRDIDIKEEIEYYARHIEIPIYIVLPSGEKYIIENRMNKPYFKSEMQEDSSLSIKTEKLRNKDFEGAIGILLEKIKGQLNLHFESIHRRYIISAHAHKNIYNNPNENIFESKAIISYNGVLVCNLHPIPEWLNSEIVFQDIDIKNKILDINLSRNQIKFNEKYKDFSNTLEDLIIPFLSSIPNAIGLQSKEGLNEFITHITESGFNLIDDEERSDRLIEEDSKLLKFLLNFYHFKCFAEDGYELMRYEEVLNCGKKIKILKHYDDYRYIQEMLFNLSESNAGILCIMLEEHAIIDSMILHLFGRESINFYDLFEIEPVYGLEGILSYKVHVINLENLNSNRLITHIGIYEDDWEEHLYVNINNKFMQLIFNYKDKIYHENRNLLKELFRYILQESDVNLMEILKEQMIILKWFEKQDIIKEEDFKDYLISKEDLEGSAYPYRTGIVL